MPRLTTQQSGFSLVEVLIAAALITVVALGFAQMTSQQARASRGLTEKVASVDVLRLLSAVISNQTKCGQIVASTNLYNSSDYPFDSTTVTSAAPKWITLKAVPAAGLNLGGLASPVASTLFLNPAASGSTPSGIELEVVSPRSANLHLRFDATKLVSPLHEVIIPGIDITTSGPPTSVTITACGSGPEVVACLSGCGGAWPSQLAMIAQYNYADKDGTDYWVRYGYNCGGGPTMVSDIPGGAGKHGAAPGANALFLCTR